MKNRSTYVIVAVSSEKVFIVDEDIGRSVTNDAEKVVMELYAEFGNKRIIYRDTMGRWDELQHDHGYFTGFAPVPMPQVPFDKQFL